MTEEYLLIDGYNVIFAWRSLKEIAQHNMDSARNKLQDILCNYQGYYKCRLLVVFDGYKSKGNLGSVMEYQNITVIFTKEAVTADQYIEQVTLELSGERSVRVVTSDRLEQMIIIGNGARRVSAQDFEKEVAHMQQLIKQEHLEKLPKRKNYLFDQVSQEMAQMLETMRLTETKEEPPAVALPARKKKKKK